MKATETYLILCKMDAGEITLQEAHEEILRLFGVVGRSEQLKADLYAFRDMFCQNIDISTIDEYVDEKGF